jgi:hypothetical protein
MIKSLEDSVHEIITTKTSRFQQITVAEIIKRVRAQFGKLQKDTKTALKLRMTSMLKTVEDLDKHIAAQTKTSPSTKRRDQPLMKTTKSTTSATL